jgi:murein DD-endopeptidase MepM/ murein hydrolase activator NlpD
MAIIHDMRRRLQAAARRVEPVSTASAVLLTAGLAIAGCEEEIQPPEPETKPDKHDNPVAIRGPIEYVAAGDNAEAALSDPADTINANTVTITESDTQFLQRRLYNQGYYAGAVDGDFGPKSQLALLRKLRDMPDILAALDPDFVYIHLTQKGHLHELQAILDKSAAHRESYLKALYQQRGHFSTEHMQYHLKYFARFYHGTVDGVVSQATERAMNQLEAHVDPPQFLDFDEQNLERATPEKGEIVTALKNGNIEWLRWHMDIDKPLKLGRPIDEKYPQTDPYLDPERDRHHAGDDYATPRGTPLRTRAPARVVFAGDSLGYGNTVILEHGAGTYTLWAHLSEITAKPGAYLQPGDVLGEAGSTGRSSGPHLHYEELLYDGQQAIEINPAKFDDYDLTNRQVRAFAIANAKSEARKHGFYGDVAISAAFTMRARGKPSPYLDQDPANRADLHAGFDVRTAQAVVDFFDKNHQALAHADAHLLYELGRTPSGHTLAAILNESEIIKSRIQGSIEDGAHKRAQRLLAASDHYKGAIDGILGPLSRTALRSYQEAYIETLELTRQRSTPGSANRPR